jgi:hypothetical protein
LRWYPKNEAPFIEMSVDAELDDGTAIAWILDIEAGREGWEVNASLRRNERSGQTVLEEISHGGITSTESLASILDAATTALLAMPIPPLQS